MIIYDEDETKNEIYITYFIGKKQIGKIDFLLTHFWKIINKNFFSNQVLFEIKIGT